MGENRGKVFHECSYGGAPPGPSNGKAADAANVHGLIGVTTCQSSNAVTLGHIDSEIKQSQPDWRTFYDNARGNIDAAIKAVYRALGEGLIDDREASSIDLALRSQQATLRAPNGPLRPIDAALRLRRFAPRRYQASPDRKASRERRRVLARGGHMPPDVRARYTEGEASVLTIIAGEVKRHGLCELPIDKIAALAGVSRTTAQNAMREARRWGHITVEHRPVAGRKNLTNIVWIVSPEWLAWLKRGPAIGFKSFLSKILSPTKREESQQGRATPVPWQRHHGIRQKHGCRNDAVRPPSCARGVAA